MRINLAQFKNSKILILGMGKEGIDTFKFLRKLFPERIFGLADMLELDKMPPKTKGLIKKDKNVRCHFGERYLEAIKDYDFIIKSPGIAPKTIRPFLKNGQKWTSQTEIFFANCPGKIVGVTGTKGKSTTASLIHKILEQGRIKSHLVGNIGTPVLSLLFRAGSEDVYVYELSCHQLRDLKKSPRIAVFLNIYREHLDYYESFEEYVKAKANIARYQTKKDILVYNSVNPIMREIAGRSRAKKIAFPEINVSRIIKTGEILLKGKSNIANIKAAIAVGKIFNVPESKISRAIKNFKGLPHRLEYVGTFNKVVFYNDSLATVPEATISAIDALGGNNIGTIILGGFERYYDFGRLAAKILENKIKTVILFPTTGVRIWNKISALAKKRGFLPKHFFVKNMKEAVALCRKHTEKGKICLLSCASPSFGLFKDYKERGNLFKKYVKL